MQLCHGDNLGKGFFTSPRACRKPFPKIFPMVKLDIVGPFLAICLPYVCSSFTKLRFKRSFWSAYAVIFFANYMFIFHKTQIQTVILRCLTSLNLSWYKSYDRKRKNTYFAKVCFWTKSQKTEMEIFAFFVRI